MLHGWGCYLATVAYTASAPVLPGNIPVGVMCWFVHIPQAVVSPGGVGFDINCGVRLVRTNLTLADVEPLKEQLAQVERT